MEACTKLCAKKWPVNSCSCCNRRLKSSVIHQMTSDCHPLLRNLVPHKVNWFLFPRERFLQWNTVPFVQPSMPVAHYPCVPKVLDTPLEPIEQDLTVSDCSYKASKYFGCTHAIVSYRPSAKRSSFLSCATKMKMRSCGKKTPMSTSA